MLDGASRISDLVNKAVNDKQPALGITDHGNMYGLIEFYKKCKQGGIKPILGIEAYMALENVKERPKRRGKEDDSGGDTATGQKISYHLTLLAKNNEGYKNLIKLSSRSFLEGYYYKPRVDWDILSEHSKGLIATTGCLGSQVNQALLNKDYKEGLARAVRLQDIFGKENLFVELQDHGIKDQKATMPDLLRIAKELNAPLLATNDCHYTEREDAASHDALLCLQTGSQVADVDRFKFEGEEHFLKTAEEMRHLFKEHPDACDSSLTIGEMCDVDIKFGDYKLPKFEVPKSFATQDEYLKTLVFEGAEKRWGKNFSDTTKERLFYELQIISDMGFSAYFLINWDLVKYAKSQNIRVGPGRGSAAGCCVAYCLSITELDPIKYNLLFERFLNPARRQMPDIDLDFDSRYREDLIRYLSQKYGKDYVAQIITFSKLKARAAVRDATRVLGHPYSLGNKLVEALPPLVMGRTTPLQACLVADPDNADGYLKSAELRDMYESNPKVKEIIDVALGLENLCRQDSIHAAAVVISAEPLTEYLPIQSKPSDKDEFDSPIVTQYEMHAVEELGLLKMDLLGLRNLDVISEALKIIEETLGEKIVVEDIPLDNKATYDLLKRADTSGVFQLESPTMRSLMVILAPDSLDDIAALVALHRPGPMEANMHIDFADRKNNRKEVIYLHENAKEILGETYGLMIYQESMMLIAQKFAGFTAIEAEELRKACGKKIRKIMEEQEEKFIDGCKNTKADGSDEPYGEKLGRQWWKQIEPFADYAFNKSHSYGYGLIAYQTAYLKANYSVQFMAALINSVRSNSERMGLYLADSKKMGLEVLPPDINISVADFTTKDKTEIPFGLIGIRNVGARFAEVIVAEREANGNFKDFFDFCERIDQISSHKKAVEALVVSGAFDSFGYSRKGLLEKYETIIDYVQIAREETEAGAVSMFVDSGLEQSISDTIEISLEDFSSDEKLRKEKELLGWYVSDHPLLEIQEQVSDNSECNLEEFIGLPNGEEKKLCGIVTKLVVKKTRKGETMATLILEDLESQVEAYVFPRVWENLQSIIKSDEVMVIYAKVKREDESVTAVINEASLLSVNKQYIGNNQANTHQKTQENGQIQENKQHENGSNENIDPIQSSKAEEDLKEAEEMLKNILESVPSSN